MAFVYGMQGFIYIIDYDNVSVELNWIIQEYYSYFVRGINSENIHDR
jgi:hypothetical protein